MKRTLLYVIFLSFSFSNCESKKNGFLFRPDFESTVDTVKFEFNYGIKDSNISNEETQIIREDDRICILSLPEILFEKEEGLKLKICILNLEGREDHWTLGFDKLHSFEELNYTWEDSSEYWEAKITSLSDWKKETKLLNAKRSFVNRVWNEGTPAFFTYTIPHVEIFEWEQGSCDFLFPSRVVTDAPSKKKFLLVRTICPNLETVIEGILLQNETWRSTCKRDTRSLKVLESFRSSDLLFSRYLEFKNESEDCLLPNVSHFGFNGNKFISESNDKNLTSIQLENEIILGEASLVFVDEPYLFGHKVSKEILSNIGTDGNFFLGDSDFLEEEFSFKQGSEYFSFTRRGESCRDQFQFYKFKQIFCGSPGISNDLIYPNLSKERIPGCQTSNIGVSEYFRADSNVGNNIDLTFFEFKNKGETCDLSSLEWIFLNQKYPLSAKEFLLEKGEVFLISKEPWFGWNFKSKPINFPKPPQDSKIPNFSWLHRKSRETTDFTDTSPHKNLITESSGNGIGRQNFSLVYFETMGSLSHPKKKLLGLENFPFWMSPGLIDTTKPNFVDGELAEILPLGLGSGNQTSRFLDFSFNPTEEGYFLFSIGNTNTYIFWKEFNAKYKTIISKPSPCYPESSLLGLENSDFETESLQLSAGIQNQIYQFYLSQVSDYLNGEVRSISPEPSPFYYTAEKKNAELCDSIFIQPGQPKNKSIRMVRSANSEKIEYYFNQNKSSDVRVRFGTKNDLKNISFDSQGPTQIEVNQNEINNLFLPNELVYSFFDFPNDSEVFGFVEKESILKIESVYPNPASSQNEWIYICNSSDQIVNLENTFIEDENSFDFIVPYSVRFPNQTPKGKNEESFISNSWTLGPKSCFWIVDPDGNQWYLPLFHKSTDLIFTVVSSQTIGNGISSGEKINLKQTYGTKHVLISSFGHKDSYFPFSISVNTGEYILLKSDRMGHKKSDFAIYREVE